MVEEVLPSIYFLTFRHPACLANILVAAQVTNSGQWTSVKVTPIICELRQLKIGMSLLSLFSVLTILEQARYR